MKRFIEFTFLSICITGLLISCKEKPSLPVLSTLPVSEVTQTTAMSGGIVTDGGGSDIILRGICWSTNKNPDISSNKTSEGTGTGDFISNLTSLTSNTGYYVRAYATNSEGTAYGNEISFTTKPVSIGTLTTSTVSSVSFTTAVSGGNITSDGGSTITSRGVCWSTLQNPMISDAKTTDAGGIGSFTSQLSGLAPGTAYYARAYMTNSTGTAYGNEISFKTIQGIGPIAFNGSLTYGTVTDTEGNVYKTIKINTQTWMAENLKATKYSDNTAIPLVTDGSAWINMTTPAYCWYKNDIYYKTFYGALYNWFAVNTGKLCPSGWHVPTVDDLNGLITYLGGSANAGVKLKEIGTSHWLSPNADATNESGFTAIPGGSRDELAGEFTDMGKISGTWSSVQLNSSNAYLRYIIQTESGTNTGGPAYSKIYGLSVRCIKD
jgi:uncharacterized protein (TIGR02145 family)